MKHFVDGNMLCIVKDDFENLQESNAVFLPLKSESAQTIINRGFKALPIGDLMGIYMELQGATPVRLK